MFESDVLANGQLTQLGAPAQDGVGAGGPKNEPNFWARIRARKKHVTDCAFHCFGARFLDQKPVPFSGPSNGPVFGPEGWPVPTFWIKGASSPRMWHARGCHPGLPPKSCPQGLFQEWPEGRPLALPHRLAQGTAPRDRHTKTPLRGSPTGLLPGTPLWLSTSRKPGHPPMCGGVRGAPRRRRETSQN